jgi:hypothetical protein
LNQEELLNHFLRLNKIFNNLPEQNKTTFFQPFTVFVSQGQFAKKYKKKFQKFNPG